MTTTLPVYDPGSPGFLEDPYPHFAELRALAPVHRSLGFWVLTRYEDVDLVLRDRRFERGWDRRVEVMGLSPRAHDSAALATQRLWILHQDPPDHTRLRGLVNKAFTPRTVERMRGRVEAIAARLLDAIDGDEVDLVREFAYPLPVTVISELLGVGADDPADFGRWSAEVTPSLQPSVTPEALRRADEAIGRFVAFFDAQVERRRRAPGDDLLTGLIAVEEQGDRLSRDELVAMCIQLCIAGFETTTSLLGSAVYSLLRFPDQLRLLRERPELLPNAVEEFLRFEAPILTTSRRAREPVEICGQLVEADEMVLACIGAANRDPERYDRPDELLVDRPAPRPISFGAGIHHCLGAGLARLEAEIALRALLDRFERIEPAGEEPRWRNFQALRSLGELTVRVSRRA
ncbi:MAG TPA: cytochrome P450 [Gaiellaceae bacterium]|nr:cytochrome P450 [Gaiellaceae bacterium]